MCLGSVHRADSNILHLVELMTARKYAISHPYHDADADDDEWGYAREIDQVAAAVNAFTYDTVIPVRQMTAISNLISMDADVRNGVEDARASLVIIPFHKEQRYDGRMVCHREGRRLLKQRLLQRAPCTVGILIERCLASVADRQPAEGDQSKVETAEGAVHDVVAVFLGGPDDRETVAYASRLAAHPSVSVMVSRFLPAQAGMDGSTVSRSLTSSNSSGDLKTVVSEEDEEAMAYGRRGVHGRLLPEVRGAGACVVHGEVREQRGGDDEFTEFHGGDVLSVRCWKGQWQHGVDGHDKRHGRLG